MAQFVLLIEQAGWPVQKVVLHPGKRYRLGRHPENEIVLQAHSVSRWHGELVYDQGRWRYRDVGSRNGSFVNGKPVEHAWLKPGDVLQLGKNPDTSARLVLSTEAVAEAEAWEENAAAPPPDAPLPFGDTNDDDDVEKTELTTGLVSYQGFTASTEEALTIGRHSRADIRLVSPVVSRRHALLKPISGGRWMLEDLGSKNGTFVNGQRIDAVVLHENDVIQIGPFRLIYRGDGQLEAFKAARGLRLDGIDLRWSAGKKRILHDISISCEAGEFVALVGGSGAGKSTLMRTLSGYLPPEKGAVLLAGDDLYRHFDAYRAQVGYVPQDDILHKDLTVAQALRYAAKLRLPPDLSEKEIEERIAAVLAQVELTGQRDQPISSLSGGQRKRASIAGELLADPPLIFLDEPTSGLDPGLEKKMMLTLRRLADNGKTILLVTHATANISVCDQVAFLSQGRMVYYGPPDEAKDFFGVGDFADIYDQISDADPREAQRRAEGWRQRYEQSPFYQKYIAQRLAVVRRTARPAAGKPATRGTRPGVLRQFFWLTRRYIDLIRHDKVLLAILVLIMPLLAGLVMAIAKPNWLVGDTPQQIAQILADKIAAGEKHATYSVAGKAQALLFMMALAATLLGLFSAAYEIIKERHVYTRERMVFLGLLPYLGSKVFVLGVFAAFQAMLFLLVVSLKVHLPSDGVFLPAPLEMYITLFLAALAALALGLWISAVSPNTNTVVYMILGVLFFQILFAGTLFELPGASGVVSRFTFTRWATEALGVSVNVEHLNSLTQTRFVPDPVTETVSFEVEKPAPDWEPVTVTQEPQEVPGCSQPVPMPVVHENEMQTVKETVEKEITVEPDPVTLKTPLDFELDYTRSVRHLLLDWAVLAAFTVAFLVLALWALKQRDVV